MKVRIPGREIESCDDCTHVRIENEEMWCKKEARLIGSIYKIPGVFVPDWCPLEDVS